MSQDFTHMSLTIPTWIYDILKDKSQESGLPMSRLIWYALDNEMDAGNPFDYQCEKPQTVFVPHAYTGEAQKIYHFLQRYKGGVDMGMLMVMRRAIGIPNKTVLMLALRELCQTKLVLESRTPPRGRFFKTFPEWMTWFRIVERAPKAVDRQRKRIDQKQAQLDKKRATLEQREAMFEPVEE